MMIEIGPTLRDRRMRDKIDMHAVEEATKIRAKYLRALENEEFNLLPGHAYAKSFLRTYADYLGLDGRALVEAYKSQHESKASVEPVSRATSPARRASGDSSSRLSKRLVLAVVLAVLLGLAFILGTGNRDTSKVPGPERSDRSAAATEPTGGGRLTSPPGIKPIVRLRIRATETVYICGITANGAVISGSGLLPAGGSRRMQARSRLFIRSGSGGFTLTTPDSALRVPPGRGSLVFQVTARSIKRVDVATAPSCGK